MRMTVGPLPSSVYWRRRAVVLGAVLLAVVVLLWSCSGGSKDDGTPGAARSATPGPVDEITPNPSETAGEGAPGGLPGVGDAAGDPAASGAAPKPTDVPVGQPVAPTGAAAQPTEGAAPGAGACTDEEILVTPVPLPASAVRGQPVELRLKIKNVSSRSCGRDVGADLQEIYIKQGAVKVWSSDRCGTARGSNQEPFAVGLEREFQVTWNGRDMTRCAAGQAAGPVPAAGEYQVFGRLGTKVSEPVKLVLNG